MPGLDAIRELQNATTVERMRDAQANRGAERSANDVMGRHDFLMLLSAQLRHQDPLNPQSDADFAAQLAQFSSLEQMMNMSESLDSMQAFGLVGQYVIAETIIDGRRMEIAGVVDSIFTSDGRRFAQIGEHAVPVSDINEVFDGSVFKLPDQLLQASNNLIGRTIRAVLPRAEGEQEDSFIEGVVVGVAFERGVIHARIDDGSGEIRSVAVGNIVEIRDAAATQAPPPNKAERPPLELTNIRPDGDDAYIQYDDEGNDIMRWEWDVAAGRWVGFPIENETQPTEPPPATEPPPETEQETQSNNGYQASNSYDTYGGSYTDSYNTYSA